VVRIHLRPLLLILRFRIFKRSGRLEVEFSGRIGGCYWPPLNRGDAARDSRYFYLVLRIVLP